MHCFCIKRIYKPIHALFLHQNETIEIVNYNSIQNGENDIADTITFLNYNINKVQAKRWIHCLVKNSTYKYFIPHADWEKKKKKKIATKELFK